MLSKFMHTWTMNVKLEESTVTSKTRDLVTLHSPCQNSYVGAYLGIDA